MNDVDGVLTGALDAAAETVRADTLRPLTEPGYRSRRPHPWLAPVAAAAAVALIIGLAVTVTGHVRTHRLTPPVTAAAATPPRYYAEIDFPANPPGALGVLIVRSVATGAVVARPAGPAGMDPANVTAAPDDRTFYVAYSVKDGIKIYSFSITAGGTVTPMTAIAGGFIDNPGGLLQLLPNFAVSPDGTNLAAVVSKGLTNADLRRGWDDVLVVISLRTGAHRVWQGGLYRSGMVLSISSMSWAGPATLDFVPSWCKGQEVCFAAGDTQVRALSVAASGGSLADSSAVLQRSAAYPNIVAVVAGSGGTLRIMATSDMAAQSGDVTVTIDQVSIAGGKVLRVLYRKRNLPPIVSPDVYRLGTDPSGQYLIAMVYQSGWQELPGRGAPHPLPGSAGAYTIAWLRTTQAVLRFRVLLWA
jgi:hypothetical protein